MATHEDRAARALASWARSGRSERQLERAVVEQLEESIYWERAQLYERIDGLTDRYMGDSRLAPAARNAALELIGELKATLKRRQHRDDERERLMPDWRTDDGKRVEIPRLRRQARPWPGPSLPLTERSREARLWTEASHVSDAPGTYATSSERLPGGVRAGS